MIIVIFIILIFIKKMKKLFSSIKQNQISLENMKKVLEIENFSFKQKGVLNLCGIPIKRNDDIYNDMKELFLGRDESQISLIQLDS